MKSFGKPCLKCQNIILEVTRPKYTTLIICGQLWSPNEIIERVISWHIKRRYKLVYCNKKLLEFVNIIYGSSFQSLLHKIPCTTHCGHGSQTQHLSVQIVGNSNTTVLFVFYDASNYFCNRRSTVRTSLCIHLAVGSCPSMTNENTL